MAPFALERYRPNATYNSFRFQNDIASITKHYALDGGVLPSVSDCLAYCAEITDRNRLANTDLSRLGVMFQDTAQPNCLIFLEMTTTPTHNSSDTGTASLEDGAKSREAQLSSNDESASLRTGANSVEEKMTRLANGRPWPSTSTPLLTSHNFDFLTGAFLASLIPAFLTKNLFAHLHFHTIPASPKHLPLPFPKKKPTELPSASAST